MKRKRVRLYSVALPVTHSKKTTNPHLQCGYGIVLKRPCSVTTTRQNDKKIEILLENNTQGAEGFMKAEDVTNILDLGIIDIWDRKNYELYNI